MMSERPFMAIITIINILLTDLTFPPLELSKQIRHHTLIEHSLNHRNT